MGKMVFYWVLGQLFAGLHPVGYLYSRRLLSRKLPLRNQLDDTFSRSISYGRLDPYRSSSLIGEPEKSQKWRVGFTNVNRLNH